MTSNILDEDLKIFQGIKIYFSLFPATVSAGLHTGKGYTISSVLAR